MKSRSSSLATVLACLVLCSVLTTVQAKHPHLNHPRTLEKIRRHKKFNDNFELDDFSFFTALKKSPSTLILLYSETCRECEYVKREMIAFSRLDRLNECKIGFVNVDRNRLIGRDFKTIGVFGGFKIALFQKGKRDPIVYSHSNYDARSLLAWVKDTISFMPEEPKIKEPKPYEEINHIVFEKNRFQIKTWHKVVFFGCAGLGIAIVSYVIKRDLDTRHSFKIHDV